MRLSGNLFSKEDPNDVPDGADWRANIDPKSLEVLHAQGEPCLRDARAGERFQFERLGYFCADSRHSVGGAPVFNRTVSLKDEWAKIQKKK